MQWSGVMPALTTAFDDDLKVDHGFIRRHALWQIENGVSGLIGLGSLGEAATLSLDEKLGDCGDACVGGEWSSAGGGGDLCAVD